MKLRTVFGLLLVMGTLVVSVCEFQLGKEAWEKAKADYRADGERLDPDLRFARPVPAADNFAAIPQLTGITRNDAHGEQVRERLALLALRDENARRRPKLGGRNRSYHAPRRSCDLRALHTYFLKTQLIPVNAMPRDPAADILEGIEREHGATISAMIDARHRPHAIFQPPLGEISDDTSPMMFEEHPWLLTAQQTAAGLRVYSVAAIYANRPSKAAQSIETMFRLSEAATAEGKTLVNHLVAIAIRAMAIESIWLGLEKRIWTSAQLQTLQKKIDATSARDDLTNAMRIDATSAIQLFDLMRSDPAKLDGRFGIGIKESRGGMLLLRPWIDHNKAIHLTSHHQGLIAPLKSDATYREVIEIAIAYADQSASQSRRNPRTILANMATYALVGAVKKTAAADADLAIASTACALERYFIATGTYPTKLRELAPKFTRSVAVDPIDESPLRYKKTADRRYQLYSIGWDAEDDGGGDGDITWDYRLAEPDGSGE